MSAPTHSDAPLLTTPLDQLHRAHGARMVPFAGYAMPVQYKAGVIAEHTHCRAEAAMFDVSHMGQSWLLGDGADRALEALVPGDIIGLKPGRQRYSVLTKPDGTILDDLMIARAQDGNLFLVTNASRKDVDAAHIRAHLPPGITLQAIQDRALLAIQGPKAALLLARLAPEVAGMSFMGFKTVSLLGVPCYVSRSGYTGEDGFEISVPSSHAVALAERLLAEPEAALAGLGARDSLRLEAGLCLYGNDIDETTTPLEAGLGWVIGKRRRLDWDFPGGDVLRNQNDNGLARLRVGLKLEGRAPARAGAAIVTSDGTAVGQVTSGTFSPSLGVPIAMGYVRYDLSHDGTPLAIMVRDKPLAAKIVPMPFITKNYHS